jgi:hypothetical protein
MMINEHTYPCFLFDAMRMFAIYRLSASRIYLPYRGLRNTGV